MRALINVDHMGLLFKAMIGDESGIWSRTIGGDGPGRVDSHYVSVLFVSPCRNLYPFDVNDLKLTSSSRQTWLGEVTAARIAQMRNPRIGDPEF